MIDFSEITKLSLKSIWRNKTRSSLTMLGIIIGVSAVILLVSLGQGLQSFVTKQFEQMGTNNIYVMPGNIGGEGGMMSGSAMMSMMSNKLKTRYVDGIKKISGPVEDVAGGIELPGVIRYKGKTKYATVAGGTGNYQKIHNLTVTSGREINDSDVDLGRKVAVIGTGLVSKFFGTSNPVGKEITIADQKFLIVGLLKDMGGGGLGAQANDYSIIPLTTAQKLFNVDYVQTITIKVRNPDDIPLAKRQVEKYMLKFLTKDDFSVTDASTLLSSITQILGALTAALGGIAAISLVVGGVGIMNIMLVSVTERTREIGLRKAIGAKPSDILSQFVIEAVTLSVVGGAIGILIGWGGSLALTKVFPTSVTPWSVALAFGVSALVGIVFGVAPAIRASRLNPIDALRYE
jgi:putative ABC transport system permease protein